ncbi:delta-like protein A [Stomoxys calcitrans]|uniref:delta-like protein A n=1 Tax=Stomoxys calcitrans TaxID=35570 RepID=UPI0027E2A09B|nr:delta-like protein A [Stomoxys calcitrans]
MSVAYVSSLTILAVLLPMAQNYDTNKYNTKASVPLWKQRACEKAQKQKANSHYICDDKGDVKCLPGWQGDLCQVPMCRKGCDPMNGYCQRPGECRCRIGYSGELCERCIPLPGCQHGDCTKPFECICRRGWDGLFCTEPSCREGCHNTRGYCEAPGECRCRIGWAGRNCSECAVLPGCQHGTCNKPLECNCMPGYTGLLCQLPICSADCHKQHGYCKKPGECRCKVGWTGPKCDQCFPYPGCVHGDCSKPWECNCKAGWGGILCDEPLSYCKENPLICENGGRCISLTKEDGNYHCECRQGYLGKNCEIVDEFMLTSTAAPRITPPPLVDWDKEENEDSSENLINGTAIGQTNNKTNVNSQNSKDQMMIRENSTDIVEQKEHMEETAIKRFNETLKEKELVKSTLEVTTMKIFSPKPHKKFEHLANISGSDIIGTATTTMVLEDAKDKNKKDSIKSTKNPIKIKSSTPLSITTSTTTTMSPLNRLEDEQHQPTFMAKPKETQSHKTNKQEFSNSNKVEDKQEEEEEEEDDEECTEDDNDDECEYVDEDEE